MGRLRTIIADAGYKVTALAIIKAEKRRIRCRLTWHGRKLASDIPPLAGRLRQEQGSSALTGSRSMPASMSTRTFLPRRTSSGEVTNHTLAVVEPELGGQ